MANHKSAKKRIRQTARRSLITKQVRSRLKTLEKQLHQSIQAKDKDAALKQLTVFYQAIDQSAKKGIHHKNKASRKKSQMTLLVNSIAK